MIVLNYGRNKVYLLSEGRENPTADNPKIKTNDTVLIILWENVSPKFPSLYIQVSDMKFSFLSKYQRYHTVRSDWSSET